jgi:hypothetical protein
MSHEARWISKLILTAVFPAVLLSTALSGCATAVDRLEAKEKRGGPDNRIFFAKYEDVENAVKQAMIKYPQRIDNTEAGIFETDYVKGDARFKPPHKDIKLDNGYRYRILLRLVKGKTEGKPSVKVQVVKRVELVRDFFSEPEQVPSDGFEEEVILYRIFRELTLARAIVKSAEKANGGSPGMDEPPLQ